MATHTICCTCGNIFHVHNAVAGARKACDQCGQPWTIPDLPHLRPAEPEEASKPAPRRIVIEHRARSSAGPVVAVVLVVAAIGGGFFLFQGEKSPEPAPKPAAIRKPPPPVESLEPAEPFRAPRTEDDSRRAPMPPPPPPPPSRPMMTNRDYQAELDLLIYRLNTAGLAAKVLDLRGKKAEADSLRGSMMDFLAALQKHLAKVRAEGHDPFVPDHLRPDDVVTHFGPNDLEKLGPAEADRKLAAFLAALRAGSRATVAVRRAGEFAELDVRYHHRPKELDAVLQVASIVPGAPPPGPGTAKKPDDPAADPVFEGPGALAVLVDPFRRTPPVDRARAAAELMARVRRSRSPSVLFMAGRYLSSSDEEWSLTSAAIDALQSYFKEAGIPEVESFDVTRHLAALKFLGGRIPDVRAKASGSEALLMEFAAAHAADSGATEADIAKAAAGLNLKRTADGRRWGSETAALRADLAMEAATGRARYAWKRFDEKLRHHDNLGVRYLGAWLLTLETLDVNKGGYDRLAAGWRFIAKGQNPAVAEHIEAIAAGVEAAAKCAGCKSGRIPCTRCGGDGKMDVTCARCGGKGDYEKGGGTVMCRDCLGKGVFKDVFCGCDRQNNQIDCPKCKGKTWIAEIADPAPSKVATFKPCQMCGGLGMPPVGVAVTCADCFGLGKILVPASDPNKTLR
jgi:hypothetical protein